jgi:hypothetical protein
MSWLLRGASVAVVAFYTCSSRGLPAVDGAIGDREPHPDRLATDRAVDRGSQPWAKRFGGVGADSGHALAVDGNGDIYIAGVFTGAVDFGGGPLGVFSSDRPELFLASFTLDGVHRWSQRLGSADGWAALEWQVGLATDGAGNVYISGTARELSFAAGSGIYVASFATTRSYRWSRVFAATARVEAGPIAVKNSHVTLAGCFDGSIDVGGGTLASAGERDILVASLTTDGSHEWSARFGGKGDDCARSLVADGAGNVYVAGEVADGADFGGGSREGPLLASFTSSGGYRWSKTLGITDWQARGALAWGGDLFIANNFHGVMVDFGGGMMPTVSRLIGASLRADGGHRWSDHLSTASHHGMAIDGDGHLLLCGSFVGTADFADVVKVKSAGARDGFLASYTNGGALRWARGMGGPGFDAALAIAVGPDGGIYVTGNFRETAVFEGTSLTSAGETDVFLFKVVE